MKRLEKMLDILIQEYESELKRLLSFKINEVATKDNTTIVQRKKLAYQMRLKLIRAQIIDLKNIKNHLVTVIDSASFI